MSSRPPFIWLPDQRIEHAAAFASLRGAPLRRTAEGTNRWILARRVFSVPDEPRSARLQITVDGRYRAWLNGQRVGSGPVRASPWFQRVDGHDVAPLLQTGSNVLAVLIHVPGIDLAWYETVKGAWQPAFGDGGLFTSLLVESRLGRNEIHGDERWRIRESPAWRRDTARGGWGQDFLEDFDANQFDADWLAVSFDDSSWPTARVQRAQCNDSTRARGWGDVEPFPVLIPGEIPSPIESFVAPRELLWIKAVEPQPDLPLQTRLYSERLLELPRAGLVTEGDTLYVRTLPGLDTALLYVFDVCHAGRPCIDFDAQGDEVIEIAVAESFPGEFGKGIAGDGLRNEGALHCAHVFRYRARPGRQQFEKFNWTAVRALQLVVRNAPAGIRIHRIGSMSTHYPALPEGAFECSDPFFNRLWETGRHTVLQCMHDAWVDCPGREARQWIGDAIVDFDVAALGFGPSVHALQRQFLQQAAESQRQDGLVRMFTPGDIGAEGLVIPDFALLWIIGAARYHRHSGDSATIEHILPAIEKALAWFAGQRDAHGLLADVPYWHFIEWANLGRDGQSAAINALYVGALDSCAELAAAVARPRLADACRLMRVQTAAALNARHWDATRGVYVDSVEPRSGKQGARVSQHANALVMLFAIAPKERWPSILEAITDPARLKLTAAPPIVPHAGPFDEARDIVQVNSFFAHFVHDALAIAGRFDWVLNEMRATYGPMLAAGATTLWESFSPAASLCHGFSATPVYQLSSHALGVHATSAGFDSFVVRPQPGGLHWARGRVPTRHGTIEVEWRIVGDELELSVVYPGNCRASFESPPGYRQAHLEASPGGAKGVFQRDASCSDL